MDTWEREYVLEHLGQSESQLIELTKGLTASQWGFKESAGRWSIAENIEHCILAENAIAGVIERALTGPEEPEKKAAAAGKEAHVKRVGDSTGTEFEAMEILQPKGRCADPAEMLTELRKVRARSVAFARTNDADLRSHFFPHEKLGDLDCYQWLVILSQHGARHAGQIEKIKRDAGYPGSGD